MNRAKQTLLDKKRHPEKYTPLGSVKAERNVEYKNRFVLVDIKEVFTSKSNVQKLIHSVWKINKQNGSTASLEKVSKDTIKLIKTFLSEHNVYEYKTAEEQATGNINWVEILKTINNDFMQYCYSSYIKWNQFVPTRITLDVGPRGNKKEKKMYELTPADIQTVDAWRNQETRIMNDMFRYQNKIPIWQTAMHTRNYDRSNEGYQVKDPDRASIETPVYNSYDMSSIHKVLDQWTSTGWFGM